MATNKNTNTNNNEVVNNQVANTQGAASVKQDHGLAYCMANSALAAGGLDNLCNAVISGFNREVKAHTQWNGRHADAKASVRGDKWATEFLNSPEVRTYARWYNTGIEYVVEDSEGNVVKHEYLLCKLVRKTEKTDPSKVVAIDAEAVCKYRNLKLSKGQTIKFVGYRTAIDDAFVESETIPTNIQREYERKVMVDAYDKDGNKLPKQVPDTESFTQEDGTIVIKDKTEVVSGDFYLVLDETITPKPFKVTLEKAMRFVWLNMIFADKRTEGTTKSESETTETKAA